MLGHFRNLRRLDLAGVDFGREALEALPPTLEALEIANPGNVSDDTFHPTGELGALAACLASDRWCPCLHELVVDLGSLEEYVHHGFEAHNVHELLYSVHHDAPMVVKTVEALKQQTARRGVWYEFTPSPEWYDSEVDQDDRLQELYDLHT